MSFQADAFQNDAFQIDGGAAAALAALVTDSGLANVIAAWAAYAAGPKYLQWGTGSGQSDTDTDLATPSQARVAGSISQQSSAVLGDTFRITGEITALNGLTITEVGVFDTLTGGLMDIYGDFAGINLLNGDAIVFSLSVTVTRV